MYIVPIAWIYVALLMSMAEATNTNGTVLGACITFVLYGVLPVGIMVYIMGTPARKRRIREQEMRDREAFLARSGTLPSGDVPLEPDASGHTPADPVTSVRKET
jgi:hypothetical protein